MSSDDFIAEACARRNRGLAHIFALEAPDGYAATAGVYALCAHESYLGGVVTREEYRLSLIHILYMAGAAAL